MVQAPFMSKARWLAFASLTMGMCAASLTACGSDDGRPASLVQSGGESGRGAGVGGGSSGAGGRVSNDAGNRSDDDDAGAAGEGPLTPAAPFAIFPTQLQVDVGCGASSGPTELVIRNGGSLPLTILGATATAGYVVGTPLPLQIAAQASAVLQVTPPAPKTSAAIGDESTGKLTFETNEAEQSTHTVQLNTTLYGAQLEFSDDDGNVLVAPLELTYLSSDVCPDSVKYRVHNTGNLAFTLLGPTFPAHLGGTSTPKAGISVEPDDFAELQVSGNSTADGACSGSGDLTFTVQGAFCGAVPKLSVLWPTNTEASGCACVAATR